MIFESVALAHVPMWHLYRFSRESLIFNLKYVNFGKKVLQSLLFENPRKCHFQQKTKTQR